MKETEERISYPGHGQTAAESRKNDMREAWRKALDCSMFANWPAFTQRRDMSVGEKDAAAKG